MDGGQIDAFLMNNVLSFCDFDVALRCPEFEMAQMLQGLYDLFSGAAYATGNADSEGDDVVGGYFDGKLRRYYGLNAGRQGAKHQRSVLAVNR